MNRNILAFALAVAAAALSAATPASAQGQLGLSPYAPALPPFPEQPEPGSAYVTYPVRDGVYMIAGPGGNIAVQVGVDGVFVVDTGPAASAPGILKEIGKLSKQPVRYIVNTSGDPDRIGGNDAVAMAGSTLEGGNTRPGAVAGSAGAPIWAHEGALTRLITAGGEPTGWPTDTYFFATKDFFFNGEPIELVSAGNAHTDGDSFVVFGRSDVVAAGNVYTPDKYPVIDIENGGSIEGLLGALNHLLRLTKPEFNQEGGTFVIPGSGRLSDEADLADYRDMATIVRDRVKALRDQGLTLAQVRARRPSFDYDPIYGREGGEAFVDAIYRSLTAAE